MAPLITNSHSSKFSGGNKRGQGEGKVPFLRLGRGEGAVVLRLRTELRSRTEGSEGSGTSWGTKVGRERRKSWGKLK